MRVSGVCGNTWESLARLPEGARFVLEVKRDGIHTLRPIQAYHRHAVVHLKRIEIQSSFCKYKHKEKRYNT
jgi:hypothetical protein